jgi:hypothetical protein
MSGPFVGYHQHPAMIFVTLLSADVDDAFDINFAATVYGAFASDVDVGCVRERRIWTE